MKKPQTPTSWFASATKITRSHLRSGSVARRDPAAEKLGLLRVADESGDDYLYPKSFFRAIALPSAVKKAVLAAA
jgi:hypothetical protein